MRTWPHRAADHADHRSVRVDRHHHHEPAASVATRCRSTTCSSSSRRSATSAATDARGIVLAANGPVFSAGHDFADMDGADLEAMRSLLRTCTDLMMLVQIRAPGRGGPGARAGHRGRVPAGGELRPGGGRRVGRRSPRPGARPDGSARRRWWRSGARWVASGRSSWPSPATPSTRPPRPTGDWSTGGPRRRARCRGRRSHRPGHPRQRLVEGARQAGVPHPDRHGSPQAYAYAIEVMAAASQTPDARRTSPPSSRSAAPTSRRRDDLPPTCTNETQDRYRLA